jgi:hypothetical protein
MKKSESLWLRIARYLGIAVASAAFINGIWRIAVLWPSHNQSFAETLLGPILIYVVLSVVGLFVVLAEREDRMTWVLVELITFAATPLIYGAVTGGRAIWLAGVSFVTVQLPGTPTRVIGIIVLIITAGLLYGLRRVARGTYGLTEVAFAIGSGWSVIPLTPWHDFGVPKSLELAPALLTGCVYITIRGLDNIEQGYKSDWLFAAALRVWKRFLQSRH